MKFKTDTCRDCSTSIIWVITATGRSMPLDATPRQNGNLVLREPADPRDAPSVVSRSSAKLEEQSGPLYVSHAKDCPVPAQQRRVR